MQLPIIIPFAPSFQSVQELVSPDPAQPYAVMVPYSFPPAAEKYLHVHRVTYAIPFVR